MATNSELMDAWLRSSDGRPTRVFVVFDGRPYSYFVLRFLFSLKVRLRVQSSLWGILPPKKLLER